jgi:hypothetical protein
MWLSSKVAASCNKTRLQFSFVGVGFLLFYIKLFGDTEKHLLKIPAGEDFA